MQDFPSETDYQTIGTTKYKTHATKTKTNVTSAEMMGMIMDLENKKDVPEDVADKKILDLIDSFDTNMEFKFDKIPLSFNDYVNYVKDNPSKTIAVLDPKTGYPKFVLKYDRGYVKLYDSEDQCSRLHIKPSDMSEIEIGLSEKRKKCSDPVKKNGFFCKDFEFY